MIAPAILLRDASRTKKGKTRIAERWKAAASVSSIAVLINDVWRYRIASRMKPRAAD
jgi:hypothetical protein